MAWLFLGAIWRIYSIQELLHTHLQPSILLPGVAYFEPPTDSPTKNAKVLFPHFLKFFFFNLKNILIAIQFLHKPTIYDTITIIIIILILFSNKQLVNLHLFWVTTSTKLLLSNMCIFLTSSKTIYDSLALFVVWVQ